MRAGDLLGREVRLADGYTRIVVGLRAVPDGPLRGLRATLRIDAVIVSRRGTGSYLGFQDREQQGPWLVGAIVRRLHRHGAVVPWEEVCDQLLDSGDDRRDATSPP